MKNNSLFVLKPYWHHDSWVFDDDRVGLQAEPFVFGIDKMINFLTEDVHNAKNGFRLIFSTQKFPGYQAELNWVREEAAGNWYYSPTYSIEGWLCPALYNYFSEAPKNIFAKAEEI